MQRTILHVDLDAFFTSVEQRDNPALRGKPVIVGGSVRRGVVSAASYEARTFGVRSAMPMAKAVKLCPQGKVLKPRMRHYAEVSAQFFGILRTYTPLCEGLSLDEAFLDVTGTSQLFGDALTIAKTIKQRVRDELSLVVSVGIAPSKFVAKIASDLKKPDGLVVVMREDVLSFLHPLPIGRLWGVGKNMEQTLMTLNIRTIGDVARIGEKFLIPHIGAAMARHLTALSNGIDARDVIANREATSIGHEDTYDTDIFDAAALVPHILAQGDKCCSRLRGLRQRARVITLKIKYADHQRITRSVTLAEPTDSAMVVADVAKNLLQQVPDIAEKGVRLTGISLSGLVDHHAPQQLSLLSLAQPEIAAQQKQHASLGHVLDAIAGRFGNNAIRRGNSPRE